MSRQNKRLAKRQVRNAEGGPRDRHLERQSRKRLCKHCSMLRAQHTPNGECFGIQVYGEAPVMFEASTVSIRLSRRGKAALRALRGAAR